MAKQQAPKRTTKTPAAQASDAPRPRRTTTTKKAAQAAAPVFTAQDIANRAYFRFLERGRVPGFEVEDWLSAEADLLKGLK